MFQVTSIDQAGVALGRILPLRAIGHLIVQEAKVAMLQGKEDGRPRPIIHQGTCPMVTRHQQVRNCIQDLSHKKGDASRETVVT